MNDGSGPIAGFAATHSSLRQNLAALGYTGKSVRTVEVANSKGVIMYHLVYASKHPLGDDIWNRITRSKKQIEMF